MDITINSSILKMIFTNMQLMLNHHFDTNQMLEDSSNLSTAERKTLAASTLATLHINRLCNIGLFLTDTGAQLDPENMYSYQIEAMMCEIVERFESIVSPCTPLTISFESKLRETDSIMLNKAYFELVILNILYCCVKAEAADKPELIKIFTSVSETRDNIIFHISDNNKGNSPSASAEVGFNSLAEVSLLIAQKSTEEMKGRLVHTLLKSGNRYDICLPKTADAHQCKMCSPARYVPNYAYFNEVFADIRLEHLLSRVIESLENEPEEVIKP